MAKTTPLTIGKRTYTDEQKTEALELYREHGPAEAARRTSIPTKTIASWASRSKTRMDSEAPQRLQIAAAVASLVAAEKRAKIADAMWDKLAESLDRLGKDSTANAQEARVITVLAEKAQLLTGGATTRVEVGDVATPDGRLATVHNLRDAVQRRGERAEDTG
jgi:transposase-like protein